MAQVIRTENLSKIYDQGKIEVAALDNVSLSIDEGEFTAIVGPSGSGKTTLLNIIGGIDEPTRGKVFIGDSEITALRANQLIDFRLRNIGFVFQSYNLIPVMTAKENIEFIMLLQNRPRAEREARVKELIKRVGLEEKAHSRPGEMSGGQQQRVAVARALASRPRFVLADEPTANLDSRSAENLLDLMASLNEDEKMTFIFSTHDPRVIQRARRVITLEDGKVVKDLQQTPVHTHEGL